MKLPSSARTVLMQKTLLTTLVFAKFNLVGFALAIDTGDCARNTLKNK